MMKVIFLDVDGVLIPYGQPDYRTVNSQCTLNLKAIVEATNAKIVISSSWRIALYQELLEMLDTFGLKEAVIDKTPRLGNGLSMRREEIEEWLGEHPEVTKYLALDDEPNVLPGKCLITKGNEGLTKSYVEQAIELLKD
jgi:hypothetical protein